MGCGASLGAYAARTTGQRAESRAGPAWRLEFGTYVEFAAKDLAAARRLVEADAERQVKAESSAPRFALLVRSPSWTPALLPT